MKETRRFFFALLPLWLCGLMAQQADPVAQGDAIGELLPGHSMHGEAFNEGPRQKAYLMEGMPKIRFPVTSEVAEVQEFFNQGVGQLHGFWYFEAERSFRQAAALDPNCAMACWGLAMANVNNDKRARAFIEKAVSLKEGASPRERLWIESLAEYYKEGKENQQRRREYVRALENIVHEYPDDLEAKAFLVFQIWDNSGKGLPIPSAQAVDSLIADVLRVDPMHPIHHYRIHLWDYEKPGRGIGASADAGPSSPGIAHMWHMPGHIYSRLHRYEDAAWQQEASARVDHAHMIRDRVLPDQIHNYAHNNEWLIRNLSHLGRVREAVDLAKNMVELPRHPKFNTLEKRGRSASHGRNRLLEILERYELWNDLIELSQNGYIEPVLEPVEEAKRVRALGLAYFSKAKYELARRQIEIMEDLLAREKEARLASADKAETEALEKKDSEEKVLQAMAQAMRKHAPALRALEAGLAELKGFDALARGDGDTARIELEKARLPKERMAQVCLELGDLEKARQLAREAVENGTNQVQLLANYVEVLYETGERDAAREQFQNLRRLGLRMDLDLPVVKRLRQLIREVDLPVDWRIASSPAEDVGERPDLNTLGPFRWEPPEAPDWALPDSNGELKSLRDFGGKPLLLIFYLGHGCLHCIEQLNLFSPLAGEFAEAGISLAAISTDAVAGLKQSLEKATGEQGYAFPLFSDESLEIFKRYRAYDDFEQMPLHGTFLIDDAGKVRWQDISYEPFQETAFLLEECRRLLKQPIARLTAK